MGKVHLVRPERWSLTRLGGRDLAIDAVALGRELLTPADAALLTYAAVPHPEDRLAARAATAGGDGRAAVARLRRAGLLVPAGADTSGADFARLVALADRPAPSAASLAYAEVPPALAAHLGPVGGEPIRLLLIGGCVLQFAASAVADAFKEAGYDPIVETCWPAATVAELRRQIEECRADVVVLMPYVATLLTTLWDSGPTLTASARRSATQALQRLLTRLLREAAAAAGDRVVLLHNLSGPGHTAYGRFEFLREQHLRDTITAVNRALDEQARDLHNVVLVDEDRLVRDWGARHLFDDDLFPFSHHGGHAEPMIEAPHQTPLLSRVLAAEYLACYLAHTGATRIKCLAVDLDDTLWPGVLADHRADWTSRDVTSTWMHLGLHQALKVARSRGVLLASVSKGDLDATLPAWRALDDSRLVTPDDFVMHAISWQPKSRAIADLCRRLRVAPSAVAVLDDSSIERAEIARFGPPVRIVDLPVSRFRGWILTEPGLETRMTTMEAATRTATTRAALTVADLADSHADGDGYAALIADLDVRLRVAAPEPADLARVQELVTRTTQFTLGAPALTAVDLAAAVRAGGVRVLRVRDRLADYGLVGVFVRTGSTVTAFAVSCRVLALDVGPVFLLAALAATGPRPGEPMPGRVRAAYRRTGRNGPAESVLRRAGFERVDGATWERPATVDPAEFAPWPHRFDGAAKGVAA